MSASVAIHAILGLLALTSCLALAFFSLRQVFRLIAAHAHAPTPVRPPLALRPLELHDDEDLDDGELVRALPTPEASVSRMN